MRRNGIASDVDVDYYADLHRSPSPKSRVLVCESRNQSLSSLSSSSSSPAHFVHGNMYSHNFSQACPVAYDFQGQPHVSPYTCVAPSQEKICIFDLKNVLVTVCGGLLSYESQLPYSFYHPSMGNYEPSYDPTLHRQYQSYFIDNAQPRYLRSIDLNSLQRYEYVIPARMIWDQHFGHLTHQSIPWIAHVLEFLPSDILNQAYWHCSVFTAAILKLLNIPNERLLIQSMYQKRNPQQPILATHAMFAYLPGWLPPQSPSFHGIANRVTKIMTKNLLEMKCLQNLEKESYVKTNSSSSKRLILYLARSKGQTRVVANEAEILSMLDRYVNHNLYEVAIINETKEYKTIEELHCIWQHHAKYFSQAAVIIGSHGSAFGNLIASPDDVDYIEFNLFPDDPLHNMVNSSAAIVRPTILAAAWNKGGTGKFYIIEPYYRSRDDFYEEEMTVSCYELIETLRLIGKDVLRFGDEENTWKQRYPPKAHGFMPKKIKKTSPSSKKVIIPPRKIPPGIIGRFPNQF
jgi:hypothetical protein